MTTKLKLRDLVILKWFKLGLRLNLDENDLKKIRKDFNGDTDDCSCEMFSLWLKSADASLQQLIEALCDVGEYKAAKQLCEKFGKCNSNHDGEWGGHGFIYLRTIMLITVVL